MSDWTLVGFGINGWGDDILRGIGVTASLSLATLPVGLVVGFVMAVGKLSKDPTLRLSSDIYTTIFRGLPELLTLFLVYYGAPPALNALLNALGLANVAVPPFLAGMIALGLVFSAFASEVFLSAFRAIPHGQREGALALGLSSLKIMVLILLPQLIKIALPGLANLWMNLLKDTALVSVIGLADTLRQADIAARVTRQPFLFFGVACLIYLVLTVVSSVAIGRIDRWTKRSEAVR